MCVCCFGDSNTYGYDPRSFLGGRYAAENRWVDILRSKTGWEIINQGMNGREIPRSAVFIPPETERLILMLGANDLLQGCEPEKAAERIAHFVSALDLPTEKILWIAPPPFAFGEWVQSQKMIDDSVAFAQFCLAQAAEQNIRCLDAGRWGVTMAYDGVHFTEQGHRAFAEGLYKEICL